MREFIHIVENSFVPQPLQKNMLDAIEHADVYGDAGWTLKDFDVKYLGLLSVEELSAYDDFSSWVEANDPDELSDFRGGDFYYPASEVENLPPIIVITAPDTESGSQHHLRTGEVGASGCMTQIGDGRGRINFANAHGVKLHAYHMIFKGCGHA